MVPNEELDNGRRPLNGDVDLILMCTMYKGRKTIIIYIENLDLSDDVADVEAMHDIEFDIRLIPEGSTDGEKVDCCSEDIKIVSTKKYVVL